MAKKNELQSQQIQAGKTAIGAWSPALQWLMQNAGLGATPGIAGPMGMPQGQMPTPQPTGPMGMGSAPPTSSPASMGSANRMQNTAGFGVRPASRPNIGQPAAPQQARIQPMPMAQPQQPMAPTIPMTPPMGMPGNALPNSALGIYGQNPADVFRLQQAEEDINRQAGQRANMLRYRLGQQGIGGSGIGAAAQMQNERSALSDFANFRRQLAIDSGNEQERRVQMILQALGIGQQAGQLGQQSRAAGQQNKTDWLGTAMQLAPLFL